MSAVSIDPTIAAQAASLDGEHVRPRRRMLLWISVGWVAVAVGAALLADLLPLADPGADVDAGVRIAPFSRFGEPLGTDSLGRSVLSRLVYGGRVSLIVGVGSAAIAMTVGGLAGLIAGAARRRADAVIGVLTDTALAFPPLILLLALSSMLQPSTTTIVIGLSIVGTPAFVRLARANTLRFAQQEFVSAARILGASPRRILFRELLPNVAPPVAAYAMLVVAILIIAESSLSYLGLGIAPPTPSWGVMIADGQPDLRTDPQLVFVPATALFLTVFSLNTLGEALRDHLDGGVRA